MSTIKITNGEVIIKDFCTRKVRKEINKALYENVEMGSDGSTKGFKPEALDNANDAALLGMIEKIVLNGEEKTVSIKIIDELPDKDVNLIIAEINKVTDKKIPNA